MNVTYATVRGNPARGYGEHLRSWLISPERPAAHCESAADSSPSSTVESKEDQKSCEHNDAMFESEMSVPTTRMTLSAEPATVLLNLTTVTRKIFAYLPADTLRDCLTVCQTFSHLAEEELETRLRFFILARNLNVNINTLSEDKELLKSLINKNYENFFCDPNFIIAFKTRLLDDSHRHTNSVGLPALAVQRRNRVEHLTFVVDGIFYVGFLNEKHSRKCSFAALQIPRVPGLAVRKLTQVNQDHALRIGHFRWMQHCMDDVGSADVPLVGQMGFLLFTHSFSLGCPDTQLFPHPFCAVKQDVRHSSDECLVWCGVKTRTASVWLDVQLHKGQLLFIRAEFQKISPLLLIQNAYDVFGLYFTTASPVLNQTQAEVAVFREFFPKAQLIGCTLNGSLFGNTASSVSETAESDRVVRLSVAGGMASASMFFVVVVTK